MIGLERLAPLVAFKEQQPAIFNELRSAAQKEFDMGNINLISFKLFELISKYTDVITKAGFEPETILLLIASSIRDGVVLR